MLIRHHQSSQPRWTFMRMRTKKRRATQMIPRPVTMPDTTNVAVLSSAGDKASRASPDRAEAFMAAQENHNDEKNDSRTMASAYRLENKKVDIL